jgi:tRNA A64-2'-O-ribosylphosphate transferase
MRTTEDDLPDLIANLLQDQTNVGPHRDFRPIRPTSWLFIGSTGELQSAQRSENNFSHIITCGGTPSDSLASDLKSRYLHLHCRKGKLGSRDLRQELPNVRQYCRSSPGVEKLLIACHDGKDLSAGVALAILCLYVDTNGQPPLHRESVAMILPDTGSLSTANSTNSITKTFIKQRLSWIMTSYPDAKPSRATLQSVNDFLMTPKEDASVEKAEHEVPLNLDSLKETIFRDLAGNWKLHRTIANNLPQGLAGEVIGEADFQGRKPTSLDANAEYLYTETSTFTTNLGIKANVKRRWIWRLFKQEAQGQISVHFVKADGETADYLYHVLEFRETDDEHSSGKLSLHARGGHACVDDYYTTTYDFMFSKDGRLEAFSADHAAKGPSKDYVSKSSHTRMSSA